MNCSSNFDYPGVCRFFKGLASSGAWVCFDEFNRLDKNVLSLVSQVIISIQGAIRNQASHLQLDESKIPLEMDCAIFVTLNPGYAGRSELPANLKSLFRSVSMVVPDSVYITEILLYSSGFLGAQQLARKIVSVQNLADVVMQRTEIAHDFGLRSIKAIVNIAEHLKLQAYNIVDCELSEIIDDESLNKVEYKPDQVVREVMNQSTPAGALKTLQQNMGNDGQAADAAAPPSPTKIKKGKKEENEGKGGATTSSPPGELPTEQVAEVPAYLRDERGLDPEEAESPEYRVAPEGKKGGQLYCRLWDQTPQIERQMKTVYKQIGIDPNEHYDETVLEEYIILKAVRDFNHSKFAAEEHFQIEGIIKDVFQGAVPDLDKPFQDYGNLKQALIQSFELNKLDFSHVMQTKALQFYEIQRTKHGCIVVGGPQSGKTTLIRLLQSAMDKAALNELILSVFEVRRMRLMEVAAKQR